ncbi:hypothetical protein MUN89_05150 [Halobacillus salinarum]|uniref:Uncharacterized protein n=1 Tax=Halobacillus salinarum TaxID=2932257 RepID=A0ABY4ELL0_9BACI|nr:hypothetical protein [Halobacillus salinarum]UOQ45337.1 hypothetical protein MUN89_05150 [Halobacillus salinarum]
MIYRIIGVDHHHIVIEFRKNNAEILFHSYEEAEEYLQRIQQENVIPEKYQLKIQEVLEVEAEEDPNNPPPFAAET